MTYYKKTDYNLIGYEKSKTKRKMYNALLLRKATRLGQKPRRPFGRPLRGQQIIKVPFGDNQMGNYQDKTGLNLYPHLIHGDKNRRKRYHSRAKHHLKKGYYSPSWFSYYILW